MKSIRLAALLSLACLAAHAKVVINEISYNPPENNDALEFVELHNSGTEPVDLSGWKFTRGIKYEFPRGTTIPANGYLLLGRDQAALKKNYRIEANGLFTSSLKNSGENLELSDAQGKRIDKVNFKDDAPWPLSADGETATLERISPEADGDDPANWASSPLSKEATKPAGSPGKQNASHAKVLPPVISQVAFEPPNPRPQQEVNISAVVRDATEIQSVDLVYRVINGADRKPEQRLSMKLDSENRYIASIPAQAENSLVRFRIEAANKSGSSRLEPGAHEPQPAFSYFVHEKFAPSKIARGFVIHADESDYKRSQRYRPQQQGGPGMMNQPDQERFMARMNFENVTDFSSLWADLCVTQKLSQAELKKVSEVARKQFAEQRNALQKIEESEEPMKEAQQLMQSFQSGLAKAFEAELSEEQRTALTRWQQSKPGPGRMPMQGPETVLQRLCNVEGALLWVSMRGELSDDSFQKLLASHAKWTAERAKLLEPLKGLMQGKGDQMEVIGKFQQLNADSEAEFATLFTDDSAQSDFLAWREETNPLRMGPRGASSSEKEPVRGANAFVFVPAEGGEPQLLDFADIRPRNAGYKVHFAKRQNLQEMTTINLIFEYNDRFVLAEDLAYDLYHRVGNAAPNSDFVRLEMDGRPFGYYLMVEQPNRAFLKRNKINEDGNLYKILWYEQGVVRQHEKKTNPQTGHDDLLALVDALEKSKGEAQWALIKKNFNVEQVINYFAVNMVLSHWDGYFNNYFTYHDLEGTGKWEMYPWDQDKTWGFHDASGDAVFYDMPITFGMEGDRPPGHPADQPPPRGFNGGHWWRAGGVFSKPLLANPEFRKHFLARTREILETVYNEQTYLPVIDSLKSQLSDEVQFRAMVLNEEPAQALTRFDRNLQSLKDHLVLRREFLLAQDEIKNAGKYDKAALK